jgi:hypothetical protein
VTFQCGNYGIGGHYGTHPDYYDYDERSFYDPESKINRISTVMTVLEAPEAGKESSFCPISRRVIRKYVNGNKKITCSLSAWETRCFFQTKNPNLGIFRMALE